MMLSEKHLQISISSSVYLQRGNTGVTQRPTAYSISISNLYHSISLHISQLTVSKNADTSLYPNWRAHPAASSSAAFASFRLFSWMLQRAKTNAAFNSHNRWFAERASGMVTYGYCYSYNTKNWYSWIGTFFLKYSCSPHTLSSRANESLRGH